MPSIRVFLLLAVATVWVVVGVVVPGLTLQALIFDGLLLIAFGVDLCSGVRSDNRLDTAKLDAFMQAARTA